MDGCFEPDGDNHAVHVYGDPGNPPIVLLHGLRLGAAIWREHAPALSTEFFVLVPDLPGHAASAAMRFDPRSCEALLREAIRRHCMQPPLIVGYSMGGYVAMRYTRDHPADSAALLLGGCTFDFNGVWGGAYKSLATLLSRLPRPMLDALLASYFRARLPKSVADAIVPLRFNQHVFETSAEFAMEEPYSESLRGYGKPVLVVNGAWDALFRSQERRFARAMHAEIAIVRGSDHAAPLRRPAEFCDIVRTFARKVFTTADASTGSA